MLGGSKRKRAASDVLPATIDDASRGTEGYPRDYAVGSLRERRLLMALRTVGFCLFGSIILNCTQTFLMVSLMPLKEVRPFLVQVVDEGSVASSIKPIEDTFEAKDILTEKLVREYVVTRHEILRSQAVMQERWAQDGFLGLTTASDEYDRFRSSVSPVLESIRQQDAQRRATILSVSAHELGKVYIVDFRSRSYDQRDRLIDDRVYTATIEIEFRPLANLNREEMLVNPTGFTVLHYTLAEKNQ